MKGGATEASIFQSGNSQAVRIPREYRFDTDVVEIFTPIGNNDLWIAAHARALDATLVMNNLREFERVAGLTLENWV